MCCFKIEVVKKYDEIFEKKYGYINVCLKKSLKKTFWFNFLCQRKYYKHFSKPVKVKK